MKTTQTAFPFCGPDKPPENCVSYMIREIKVCTVRESPPTYDKTDCPERCVQFWNDTIRHAPWFDEQKEQLVVLLLDTRFHLSAYNLVSIGTLNEAMAHPREVFRPAIVLPAAAIVVMHNHPSGDPSPSQSDHSLTRRLKEAAELLQIKLLDHVVVGQQTETRPGYFSFKEAGVL